MRIAFDHQIFVQQAYGGISRYFTHLAEDLFEMGQQVGIFAPIYCNSYLSALPKEIVHGKYVSRYPPKSARLFIAFSKYVSQYRLVRWQPDLVHETYYSRSQSTPACPVVLTVLDMIHDLFPSDFSAQDKTVALKRQAVARADQVICISHNTKADLVRLYNIADSKVSVVHLGFDHFADSPNGRQFVTPTGRPFILYVGYRSGYKNFLGLLSAVSSSRQLSTEFDIVAFGGGCFSATELTKISELGFVDNQVIHKSGSDELLGSIYRSARGFVYPSLYEGFGIPPLEAMAHQCPVITSNTGPMPEVAGDAAEYFDPVDTGEMCAAIEKVIYSEQRTQQLIARGNERIKQFSWEKCSQETLDVYQKLL